MECWLILPPPLRAPTCDRCAAVCLQRTEGDTLGLREGRFGGVRESRRQRKEKRESKARPPVANKPNLGGHTGSGFDRPLLAHRSRARDHAATTKSTFWEESRTMCVRHSERLVETMRP